MDAKNYFEKFKNHPLFGQYLFLIFTKNIVHTIFYKFIRNLVVLEVLYDLVYGIQPIPQKSAFFIFYNKTQKDSSLASFWL